ncbi:MAG: sigma-54-dependent Fis family transcriptional regulator [Deltaproteobacteria bacterium]|jgi:DNA-binding NtrC family response regulator|nr:sigma-54-dependent Fis family transcriptional regulator [Deltaproteobacteria bacterium]MBW2521608.1 sigma-54-dependent Fis family transcriptional regulator [Deltaproteobacteria bacterium]
MARILLAEDDEIMRETLFDRLAKSGWQVDSARDGREAIKLVEQNFYNLVLSDIRMPGLDGTTLLGKILRLSPGTDVILMTAYGSVESAVTCLKKGAADYILKPFDMDDLTIRIMRLLDMQAMRARCSSLEEQFGGRAPIIGSSWPMQSLLAMIDQVAASDTTVLITGESGTGKELVAAAIHYGSQRSSGPYIRINCAAIPENLMESELFGHEKGAFTGADARKIGKFEAASGGTILLDEIGEMPLPLQAKLLRVLQEREIERVGGNRTIKVDVRIICSTAKNLAEEARRGSFREDLFYRLQVIPILVPPLRERKEDIPELCRYFLEEFSKGRSVPLQISEQTLRALKAYDYPGNVRELKNILERISVLAAEPVIEPWHLPPDCGGSVHEEAESSSLNLAAAVAATEKAFILKALRLTGGRRAKAAELLGISRKNLWEKLKLHNVSPQ